MPRILLALVFAVGVSACTSAADLDADPVSTDAVSIRDNAFIPAVIEVPAGTTVTWSFDDSGTAHDVTGESFASETQREGTFAHTFAEPGTYDYRCTLHRGMRGRVVVVAQ